MMAKHKNVTWHTVQAIGLALPDVEAGTSYGALALKVRGKMFACRAINKSAEPDSLWVRVSFAQRDELIDADPHTYYATDHYINYAGELVRLSRVHADTLRDLLLMAWRFMSTSGSRSTGRRQAPGRRKPFSRK